MQKTSYSRPRFVITFLCLLMLIGFVGARLVYVGYLEQEMLTTRADYAHQKRKTVHARRGVIYDRNGYPLAVSAPLHHLVFNAKEMLKYPGGWKRLSAITELEMSKHDIKQALLKRPNSQFWYAKKDLPPDVAQKIRAARVPGISLERHPHSFYPEGDIAAQLVGFTDNDDRGQEGLERQYDRRLSAEDGQRVITQNAIGQVLKVVKTIAPPQNGNDLYLSIDKRLQYITYQVLKETVEFTGAENAQAVVLDPHTGEVLAVTSYPSFNPNASQARSGKHVRNAAITDSFEPGSTMKTFAAAVAIDQGLVTSETKIPNHRGRMKIGKHTVKDEFDYGDLTVTQIIKHSSNVGTAQLAHMSDKENYDAFLRAAGFGSMPSGQFPGETSGRLPHVPELDDFSYATLSFGYALSTSVLQLANAYASIASGGIRYPITFEKQSHPPLGIRVMSEATAQEMQKTLEAVVEDDGSGRFANIPGYSVAGKTGTSHKASQKGGYDRDRKNASFVGYVPTQKPKLVIAVRVNEPKTPRLSHYGAISAAPAFARIAQNSLRVLGIPPSESQINLDRHHTLAKRYQYYLAL